jgi:hypothetical protein
MKQSSVNKWPISGGVLGDPAFDAFLPRLLVVVM